MKKEVVEFDWRNRKNKNYYTPSIQEFKMMLNGIPEDFNLNVGDYGSIEQIIVDNENKFVHIIPSVCL